MLKPYSRSSYSDPGLPFNVYVTSCCILKNDDAQCHERQNSHVPEKKQSPQRLNEDATEARYNFANAMLQPADEASIDVADLWFPDEANFKYK